MALNIVENYSNEKQVERGWLGVLVTSFSPFRYSPPTICPLITHNNISCDLPCNVSKIINMIY
jgi:hypothetical protein